MNRRYRVVDVSAMHAFANGLAAGLRAGDVVTLSGDIGAGKTTLVRAVVEALIGSDIATSPSFMLWQRYGTNPSVNHLDLYRIEEISELRELGLEEAFDAQSITFVEWPERAPSLIPPSPLVLHLSGAGDEPREIEIITP